MKNCFTYGYPNIPIKKYYSYHGMLRDCPIQTDPGKFYCEDLNPISGAYHEWIIYASITNSSGLYFEQTTPGTPAPSYPNYLTVRNNPVSNYPLPETANWIGQWSAHNPFWPYKYYIYRIVLYFQGTTSIPITAPIYYTRLDFKPQFNWAVINFDIVIQNGQPGYPHTPVVPGDYYYDHYSGNGGSINSADLVFTPFPYIWNSIILNPIGLSWINVKGGENTKLCLRSSRDISAIMPNNADDDERIGIQSNPTYQPRLIIRVLVSIPTLFTFPATYITSVRARFKGQVQNNGYWLDSYGFEWKKGIGGFISSIQRGTYPNIDIFSYFKYGLDPDTIYYYRAWAENEAGKGYGLWVEFKTLP